MHTHIVQTSNEPRYHGTMTDIRWENTLLSFAYKGAEDGFRRHWLAMSPNNRILLDSGAFTLWSQGLPAPIEGYIPWAKEMLERWSPHARRITCVNLDIIPGQPGRAPTRREIERGMTGSLENADRLRSEGLPVMEVFHQGEPREFLRTLLERLPPNGIMGVSPDNSTSAKKRFEFLQQTLRWLLKERDRETLPRTHGLGVTSRRMLLAFPFYSVDSSSWVAPRKFGAVGALTVPYVPRNKGPGPALDIVMLALRREMLRQREIEREATNIWRARGVDWGDS
jgi:hypothetical protein